MKLTITPPALARLEKNRTSADEILLLHYDTEECGCGVNGVPTIRLVEEVRDQLIRVESESIPVWINNQQATFFEEEMKLDFVNHAFRLSSPAGILNPVISQRDLRQDDIA